MQRTWLLVGVLVILGCGKGHAPPAGPSAGHASADNPSAPPGQSNADNPTPPVGQVEDTDLAPQICPGQPDSKPWSEKLADPNHAVRAETVRALRQLGEVGYPHFLEAMKNKEAVEVRLAAMEGISKKVLASHHEEMVPLMLDAIRDANPRIRHAACRRLTEFASRQLHPNPRAVERQPSTLEAEIKTLQRHQVVEELRKLCQTEKDPHVKREALTSARLVHWNVTGVMLPCEAEER